MVMMMRMLDNSEKNGHCTCFSLFQETARIGFLMGVREVGSESGIKFISE